MNTTLRHLGSCLMLIVTATSVQAGSVSPNGVVLINRGNGFEAIAQPTHLRPGDRVLVQSGSAQITCRDGSVAHLHSGQLFTAGACDAAHPHARHADSQIGHSHQSFHGGQAQVPAQPETVVVEGSSGGAARAASGLSGTAMLGAAAGVAGLAVLIASISKDSNKPAKPSSP